MVFVVAAATAADDSSSSSEARDITEEFRDVWAKAPKPADILATARSVAIFLSLSFVCLSKNSAPNCFWSLLSYLSTSLLRSGDVLEDLRRLLLGVDGAL